MTALRSPLRVTTFAYWRSSAAKCRGRRRGHLATSAAACSRRATTPTSPITCGRLWHATGLTRALAGAPGASLVRAHALADLERAEYGHVLGLQAERQGLHRAGASRG